MCLDCGANVRQTQLEEYRKFALLPLKETKVRPEVGKRMIAEKKAELMS
jgi:hypothetical protein